MTALFYYFTRRIHGMAAVSDMRFILNIDRPTQQSPYNPLAMRMDGWMFAGV
jgi:hypothetical protein